MNKDEMKNRISMALTDPILQQGFEIICKDLAERKKEIAELEKEIQDFKETNHELAETCIERKKRIAELEKENAEAKEILQDYIRINLLPPIERNFDDEVELFKQAEQFLKEVENDR